MKSQISLPKYSRTTEKPKLKRMKTQKGSALPLKREARITRARSKNLNNEQVVMKVQPKPSTPNITSHSRNLSKRQLESNEAKHKESTAQKIKNTENKSIEIISSVQYSKHSYGNNQRERGKAQKEIQNQNQDDNFKVILFDQ